MTVCGQAGSGAQGGVIGVIGAGAWGTALAQAIASDGSEVMLWAREPELAESINRTRRNPLYLAQALLAPSVHATSALADLAPLRTVLAVVPAQFLGSVLADLPADAPGAISCFAPRGSRLAAAG